MSFNKYDVGDSVTLSTTFTVGPIGNEDPADPGSVLLLIRKPDDSVTTYVFGTDAELVRDGVGEYHTDLIIDMAGVWRYRWAGEDSVVAAEENAFQVKKQWVVA